MRKLMIILAFLAAPWVASAGYIFAGNMGGGTATSTSSPSAPSSVVCTPGNATNTITWTASTGTPTPTYNLYRSTTSGSETLETTGVTSGVVDGSLTNGTEYYYKVASTNSAGTAYSPEVNGTPTAGATWSDAFTGSAWSSYSRYTTGLSGDGAWTWSGSAVTASSAGQAVTSGAMTYLNIPINKSVTSEYQIQMQLPLSTGNAFAGMELAFGTSGGLPSIGTNASWGGNRGLSAAIFGNGGSPQIAPQYDSTTGWQGVSAVTSGSWGGTYAYYGASVTTTYTYIWDFTPTTVQLTVKNGSTTVIQTPTVLWTSFANNGSYPYIIIGDPWTDYYFPAFKIISFARTI